MMLCAWFTGISVYVTCLVVAPLLALLPRTSLLWRPGLAAAIGAAVAPGVLYLWLSIFRMSVTGTETTLYVSLTYMIAGAIFAASYAALLRRRPQASASMSSTPPHPCTIPDQKPTG